MLVRTSIAPAKASGTIASQLPRMLTHRCRAGRAQRTCMSSMFWKARCSCPARPAAAMRAFQRKGSVCRRALRISARTPCARSSNTSCSRRLLAGASRISRLHAEISAVYTCRRGRASAPGAAVEPVTLEPRLTDSARLQDRVLVHALGSLSSHLWVTLDPFCLHGCVQLERLVRVPHSRTDCTQIRVRASCHFKRDAISSS